MYQKAVAKNGQLVITESRVINQRSLTSDCWSVQFEGLAACKECAYRNTKHCGGGETLKRIKSKLN